MPDTNTTNYGFVKPEIDGSIDTWGGKLNNNWSQLDTILNQMVGMTALFAAEGVLTGWLRCNGQTVSRTTYARLWNFAQSSGQVAASEGAKEPGQFGPGDGATTFSIPDLRGRFLRGFDDGAGVDSGRVFGTQQASANKSHTHTTSSSGSHDHGAVTGASGSHGHSTNVTGAHSHSASTNTTGAHTHTYNRSNAGTASTGGSGEAFPDTFTTVNTSFAGSHSHSLSVGTAGSHTHTVSLDGSHSHTTTSDGGHTHGVDSDGELEARPGNVALGVYILF